MRTYALFELEGDAIHSLDGVYQPLVQFVAVAVTVNTK